MDRFDKFVKFVKNNTSHSKTDGLCARCHSEFMIKAFLEHNNSEVKK